MGRQGENIIEFKNLLNRLAKSHVKVQTAWVTVKSVDWSKKTMVATGVTDGLDYHDVLLGLDGFFRKPAIGSKCLIGLIENQDAASFLMECSTVEEFIYISGQTKLRMTPDGFEIERAGESLTKLLNDMLQANIEATYTNGAGTTSPANNVAAFTAIKNRVPNLLK